MKIFERFKAAWSVFCGHDAEIVNQSDFPFCATYMRPGYRTNLVLKKNERMQLHPLESLFVQDGLKPITILKTGDSIGELSAVLQHPDGTVRNVVFDADRPVTVPAPFRVVQIGHIGSGVKLDSPNDSPGAMLALALSRYNQNVMREAEFKASVYDEVNSTDQAVKVSTVGVAFGPKAGKRHRFQITIERTTMEPAEMVRRTPLVIQEGK